MQTSPPKFSVIIPTYNRATTIPATINAILQQTNQDFEIIVMDDGSTDDTNKELEFFNEPRLKIFKQRNGGCANARSNGCDQASGEWLCFCDSDDIWTSGYLSRIDEASRVFDTDVIFTNYQVEGETQPRIYGNQHNRWLKKWKVETFYPFTLMSEDLYIGLLEWQPTFPSAFSIKRDFYKSIGGIKKDLGKVRSEDGHLTRRAAAFGRFTYIDANLVMLGRQEDNLSSSFLENLCGGVSHLERFIEQKEIPEKYFNPTKEEIINHHKQICDQAYWAGNYKHSLRAIRRIPMRQWSLRTYRNFLFSKFRTLN